MPVRRCAGSLYTVKNGDTCKSIAAANSLAIDRFLADNSYDFDCTYMSAGDSVCIQDGCKLHTVSHELLLLMFSSLMAPIDPTRRDLQTDPCGAAFHDERAGSMESNHGDRL
jgi:hypothetical protein